MRKFKVVKKWPGGPEVGSIGELGLENVSFASSSNYGKWHTLKELEGFVEEVKEPEVFWTISPWEGVCCSSDMSDSCDVKKEWLFRTKESAEKFAKALSIKVELFPTVFQGVKDSYILLPRGDATKVAYDMLSALNDRVK